MVYILVIIKNAVERGGDLDSEIVPETFPDESKSFTPLVFNDYLTALQAKRICIPTGDDDYMITGYDYGGSNWPVPLLKCDSRNCKESGQDAGQTVCEYNVIGIAGDSTRVLEFVSWLESKYPILADSSALPFDFSLFKKFTNSGDMDSYVTSSDYGVYPAKPKLAMGIVFNGNDPNVYDYSLRQNSTNFNSPEEEGRPATRTTPNTEVLLGEFEKSDEYSCLTEGGTPYLGPMTDSCTGQYMYNGVLTFQRLVHDFILDATGASAAGSFVGEASVQYVPFPTRPYKDAGFYAQIGGK
jgi:hypothetical protein